MLYNSHLYSCGHCKFGALYPNTPSVLCIVRRLQLARSASAPVWCKVDPRNRDLVRIFIEWATKGLRPKFPVDVSSVYSLATIRVIRTTLPFHLCNRNNAMGHLLFRNLVYGCYYAAKYNLVNGSWRRCSPWSTVVLLQLAHGESTLIMSCKGAAII